MRGMSGMSTQLPTWRFHAVDPSLLVRVDHDGDEASVRPRAKSTRPASGGDNAAGKAAATRKMDQLKEMDQQSACARPRPRSRRPQLHLRLHRPSAKSTTGGP